MWKTQLKIGSKTFTKPKVKLTVDPDDSDKCCEEAKEKYINNFLETLDLTSPSNAYLRTITPKEAYKSMFQSKGIADRSCEEFRRWIDAYEDHPPLQKISDEWEECDNVENST